MLIMIYRNFEGKIEDKNLGVIEYKGIERDWNVLGNTPEENRALGRVVEVIAKNNRTIAWADNEKSALENLLETLRVYALKKQSK